MTARLCGGLLAGLLLLPTLGHADIPPQALPSRAAVAPTVAPTPAATPSVATGATRTVSGITWQRPTTGNVITQFSTASKGVNIAGTAGQPVVAGVVDAAEGQRRPDPIIVDREVTGGQRRAVAQPRHHIQQHHARCPAKATGQHQFLAETLRRPRQQLFRCAALKGCIYLEQFLGRPGRRQRVERRCLVHDCLPLQRGANKNGHAMLCDRCARAAPHIWVGSSQVPKW